MSNKRITVYIDDAGDKLCPEYRWMEMGFARWDGQVRIADYSSGGWEHVWDLEGPPGAIAEVPEEWLCSSEWATPHLFRA